MIDLKYTDILRINEQLGKTMQGNRYTITVFSNIITSQFNDILEYSLRTQNINSIVNSGDYDNILQDATKFSTSDLIVIFWEAANLVDGLQYKANVMDDAATEELLSKVCNEIDFVLESLNKTSLVLINRFSGLLFNHSNIRNNSFDKICKRLNGYLEQKTNSNLLLVDIDKIFAKLSITKSRDFRYYYSSKALYTIDFYKAYSQYILPIIKSINGKTKKALIFDCDNTLWKGILGEDGIENIEVSGKTKGGVVFEEVQHLVIDLYNKGILIGICSKNNPEDIENVFSNHPGMTISNQHISIKKINWNDKATNLKEIAQELNIGLESIVFVDDSDFELGLVKQQLPEVETLKVPANLYEYPQLLRDNQSLFYSSSESAEDLQRAVMYKQQAIRVEDKKKFHDIESYLNTLDIKIFVHLNPLPIATRISQLTQKTNQFNLTTKRYTEADINSFINSEDHVTFAFDVSDKYGDSGITGVSILQTDLIKKTATIDSLLMSCRVLGRNIEFAFFDFLIDYLKALEMETISASYIKSFKNKQVSGFYETLGFICVKDLGTEKVYELKTSDYIRRNINYINLSYGGKN
jgi:FkbH-like protein